MSKLKIERSISRTERVKLQVSIEQSIAADIELMAKWSDNEKNYIVNELLRFALNQASDFQKYKSSSMPDQSQRELAHRVHPASETAGTKPEPLVAAGTART